MARIKSCIVLFALFLINIVNSSVIVSTYSGKVEGIEVKSILKNEKYYSFMGIPYAKPPVGDMRFKPPQPHEGWTDILSAKKEKKTCSQFNFPIRRLDRHGFCGEDDCLNLSVHTPKLPNDDDLSMPVIVFLYDEYFRMSHNGSRDFGPDFIVKEDVVFVTVNYRLGAIGFLSLQNEQQPGNNGLRDIILALKWLRANIQMFGGDPNRITLMGVEGGAVLADLLLTSTKAKGLFSGVILQSATAMVTGYLPSNPKEKASALAKELKEKGVAEYNLVKDLLSLPSIDIASAELPSIDADECRVTQTPTNPFGPVVEPDHPDAIVTRLPEEGPLNIDIPVMIGYNSKEGIEKCERYLRKPEYLTFADRDFLMVFPIRSGYRFDFNSNIYYHCVDEIKEFYFDEGYVKISKPGEFINYMSDVMTVYPIDYTVRKYVNESNAPIYYYTFDYSGEFNMRKNLLLEESITIDGTSGAVTGDELCYLFVCKPIKKTYTKVLADEDAEEIKVIKNMVKLWTNFAKTGNPTPEGSDFKWTPATKENKECLVISDELQMKKNIHEDRIKFWDNLLAKYKEMAVDGVVKDVKDEL